MNLHFSPYQRKMFLLCLLLGAVPVLVLGIFSYARFSSTIQSKVHAGNDQLLQQTQMQIENTLQIVDFSIFQLVSSRQINEALSTDITNRQFSLVNDLFAKLQQIQIYDLGIQNIQLYSLVHEWKIGNEGFVRFDAAPGLKQQAARYADIQRPSAWLLETDAAVSGAGASPVNPLVLIKKITPYSTNPSGIIVARMSSRELFKYLPEASDNGAMVILDEKRHVVAGNDSAGFGKAIADSSVVQSFLQSPDKSGYEVAGFNGQSYGITYRKSAYNGWIYLSVVSIGEITRESHAIGWFTFWTCAVMIALILLLSLQSANRLYSPIRRLYRTVAENEDAKEAVPEAAEVPRDEFQAIENRFERIFHRYREMTTQVETLHQQLKPLFVMKLVRGELQPQDVQEQLERFGYDGSGSWLAVVAIQIDTLADTRFQERDRDLLLFAIHNIVAELIPADRRLEPIVLDRLQISVLRGDQVTEEAFREFILEQVQRIRDMIKSYIGVNISAGVSRVYRRLEDSAKAYAEGADALKYRITKERDCTLFIDDVEPVAQLVFFPDHLEKELVEAVMQTDDQRAAVLLREFMGILANRELTFLQMQNWLMKLLMDLVSIPEHQKIHVPVLSEGEIPFYEELSRQRTVEEIERWFLERIIVPIMQALEHSKESQTQKIAQEIVQIIQSEYDRDLTLEECASRLHYDPSYIRRVLKKTMNVNFKDYLLQYRMEIAKKWLTDSDMKIADIAARLQYNNPQNFIRYFKKTTGVTPGQYRDQAALQGESHA